MKVCIIGAGISGLSCAITLEKYGIPYDIYEQNCCVGGRTPFVACLLQIMKRPVRDPLTDLVRKYDLSITPNKVLNRMIMFSPHMTVRASGWLGYVYVRGPSSSIDTELSSRLKTNITFNAVADYKEMSSRYDRVVIATGSPYIAKELGVWDDYFRTWVRGSVVEGKFDPTTWIAWFNKSYANNGYAYLGPFDRETASLVLIVSDIKEDEVEQRWEKFISAEKISYKEKQSFMLEHIAGVCTKMEIDNTLLVGNAAGMMDSVLGFGIYGSIASGVLAARSIALNIPYEESLSFIKSKLYQFYVVRRDLNKLQNSHYDYFFRLLKNPVINKMTYNTNIDFDAAYTWFSDHIWGPPVTLNGNIIEKPY